MRWVIVNMKDYIFADAVAGALRGDKGSDFKIECVSTPEDILQYAAANTRKYTDMFRAGEIDPSVPGQAICLEAYKESEMFYLSLINRLDQK